MSPSVTACASKPPSSTCCAARPNTACRRPRAWRTGWPPASRLRKKTFFRSLRRGRAGAPRMARPGPASAAGTRSAAGTAIFQTPKCLKNEAAKGRKLLHRVVVAAGSNKQYAVPHLVGQAVLLVDAARPISGPLMTQRLGLADTTERVLPYLLHQLIHAFVQPPVMLVPPEIILPGLIGPLEFHRGSFRALALPASI